MKLLATTLTALLFITTGLISDSTLWTSEKHQDYILHYTGNDKESINEYVLMIDSGIKSVKEFFNSSYKNKFDVFIFPDRQSLDKQWATDWKIPGFRSECWMVASGVSGRLDMLSPKAWEKEACEHNFKDSAGTQQLITHELVHVFHGQSNNSEDFSDVTGLDWFVEGLATYASGQCTENRIAEIKKAIGLKEIPASLDEFWTGKLKYGLSGSMVMYIDSQYGRDKLKELLKIKTKAALLEALKISEADLLSGWEAYMKTT